MIVHSCRPAELQSTRWKALRLGLRLANSNLGAGLIGGFYGLWCVIGLILCLVLIPFAIMGKFDAFEHALNPIALYGFGLPIGLMAATTWIVKLVSRLLWCGIPEPAAGTIVAFASVAGRVAVLVALGYIWFLGEPFGKGLLLPKVIACSGMAWLGLIADWGFIRTLQHEFILAEEPAQSSGEMDNEAENVAKDELTTEQPDQSIFGRDLGKWFKSRFPRMHKFTSWILLPLAYVIASSMADNGSFNAVPDALLRLMVMIPAILQTFWVPGREIGRLIDVLSPPTAQEVYSA